MGRIRQLDTQTANMIAAGEVVERPMGIVKELVENSIDAGSTRILISVEEGGLSGITIQDDGCGMDSEDAQMAFKRHATSKIQNTNDLWSIHTLGFRGEALPSIASVAKVSLTTSDGSEGTRIKIAYGETQSVSAYPCNKGTEITVEGLFYQTPARLKHMRSAAYENSLIQDVISRFALSHPEIAFTFISSGKESLRTTGQGNLLEVLYQVWGREAAENAIPVSFTDYDYNVEGYLVKPNVTRASRNYMQLFLNERMVRTFRLYKAVQDGYEDFIVKGRYPLVVLNIRMDAQLLDVNVHPSKWEVRLSKENQLEELIRREIRETFKKTMLAPEKQMVKEPKVTYYEALSFDDALKETPKPVIVREETEEPVMFELPVNKPTVIEKPVPERPANEEVPNVPVKEDLADTKEVKEEPVVRNHTLPEMQVIGQLHGKWILCAVENGLAVLDQHACQERVHYEEIRNKMNQNPIMMDLLVPITIETGQDLVRRAEEINEAIKELHVSFEPFGPDTLLVRQIPAWMKEIEEEPFLRDLLDYFRDNIRKSYAVLEKKKIATMACHHSIRFNRNLSMGEMVQVVEQLKQCENPYHCPHGRPTFIILDEKEMTKEFLR